MCELARTIDDALVAAFAQGILDVPFCLHPDNASRSRACLDSDGRLRWLSVGDMPLRATGAGAPRFGRRLDATTLLGIAGSLS